MTEREEFDADLFLQGHDKLHIHKVGTVGYMVAVSAIKATKESNRKELEEKDRRIAELEATLSQIILEGDYTAPEGMKRIAEAALAGRGREELTKREAAARQQGFEEGKQAGRDKLQKELSEQEPVAWQDEHGDAYARISPFATKRDISALTALIPRPSAPVKGE